MEPMTVMLSERTLYAAEQYTQIKVAMELAGGMTSAEWEHARSYAVEAVFSLLMDNPTIFRLAREMQQIVEARKRP